MYPKYVYSSLSNSHTKPLKIGNLFIVQQSKKEKLNKVQDLTNININANYNSLKYYYYNKYY